MSIISISRDTNNNVSLVRMEVSDNLATVASANYILNNQEAINILNGGVWSWFMTDMILVAASDANAFFQFTNNTFHSLIIYGEQGSGTINPGLTNQLAFYPANGATLSGLPTAPNGVLITSAGGAPSISSTLPSAVQSNITATGTIITGVWNGTPIDVPHGGTGNTTFTAFTLICAGTTATGAFQNVVSVGTLGQVLVSNGPGALPSFQTGVASGIINTGNQNDLPFYSASPSGKTLSPISGAVNSVLVTSGLGVPSLLQTLPTAVQGNITSLGTITSGVWNGTAINETHGGTNQTSYILGDTLYASAANTLSKLAGNTTTAKQYLSQTGTGAASAAPVWATISGADITGAALTEVNDTNVTMTLGGSPTTALLRATSMTLGWTGQLGLTRGGTAASLTASNGGIVYSTASALAILAGTATANQVLLSGSNTTPAWSTATYPVTTTINQLLYSSAANTITGLTSANNGLLVTSSAGVPSILAGPGTTGNVLQSNAAAAPSFSTATFPSTATSTGTILRANGTNWVASTATFADTYAINTLLYASGANAVTGLATSTTAVLTTSAGVPTWAAQLSLALGGTNAALTASNGGIFYSTASAGAILSGTATAGLALLSGSNAAPTWSTSPPITQVKVTRITATGAGTYTPTAGMQYVIVAAQAGGGGGGGGATTTTGQQGSGGGGGGGEYIEALFTAANIGASKAYSVGAKGAGGTAGNNPGGNGTNTTFNTTWIITNGGTGGSSQAATTTLGINITPVAGGSGGSVSTGTLLAQRAGQFGGMVFSIIVSNTISGGGGSAGCGAAGGIPVFGVSVAGSAAAANSGAGGSGASTNSTAGTQQAGGNGGDGFITFVEFISV